MFLCRKSLSWKSYTFQKFVFFLIKGTPLGFPENRDFLRIFEFLFFFKRCFKGYERCSTPRYFILKHFYMKSLGVTHLRQLNFICTHQAHSYFRTIIKKRIFYVFQTFCVSAVSLQDWKFHEKLNVNIIKKKFNRHDEVHMSSA